jgi:hypothetical protein
VTICPSSPLPCLRRALCVERGLCCRAHYAPIDELFVGAPAAVHFVGFRGDEYHSAVRAFGPPDFVHRVWDVRAAAEVAPHDTVVFARYHGLPPTQYSHDDSNQPDDPAAAERRSS